MYTKQKIDKMDKFWKIEKSNNWKKLDKIETFFLQNWRIWQMKDKTSAFKNSRHFWAIFHEISEFNLDKMHTYDIRSDQRFSASKPDFLDSFLYKNIR